MDYTKVIILILWWRNFQLEYWRTFQLVSTEFGIVRNNIYSVNITSIKNLGPGNPDTKPGPDEYKAYLDVEFGVYPWIVRDQDADLE